MFIKVHILPESSLKTKSDKQLMCNDYAFTELSAAFVITLEKNASINCEELSLFNKIVDEIKILCNAINKKFSKMFKLFVCLVLCCGLAVEAKNWALLTAGSNTWDNYRHQVRHFVFVIYVF